MKRLFKKLVKPFAIVLVLGAAVFLFADYHNYWNVHPNRQVKPDRVIGRTIIDKNWGSGLHRVDYALFINRDHSKNALRWQFKGFSDYEVFGREESLEWLLKMLDRYDKMRETAMAENIKVRRSLGEIAVVNAAGELKQIRFEFRSRKTSNFLFRRFQDTIIWMDFDFRLDNESSLSNYLSLPHYAVLQLRRLLEDLPGKESQPTPKLI